MSRKTLFEDVRKCVVNQVIRFRGLQRADDFLTSGKILASENFLLQGADLFLGKQRLRRIKYSGAK
jgi:hypothetical protein